MTIFRILIVMIAAVTAVIVGRSFPVGAGVSGVGNGGVSGGVSGVVSGAPQDYSWTYNVTNVYTSHVLSYSVSGLDTAEQYIFTFQLLDEFSNVVNVIDQDLIGPGVASGTFGTGFEGFEDAYGPMRVIDQFGQVLGKHFVAPAYLDSWQGNGGVTDAVDKQGIGDVPYIELNPDYHHPITDHSAVLTQFGDWTLLHFRSASSTATNRFIELFDISTHASVAEFSLDELIEYQHEITDILPYSFETLSFVVLNTAGNQLDFINQEQDAFAFNSSYDNPHELYLPAGIYEYARYTGAGGFISFGESVFIVSNSTDGVEWSVLPKLGSAVEFGQQCALLYQKTSAVWNGYSDQLLEDSAIGTVDDTDYAYDNYREHCYTTGDFVDSPATITWGWQATSLVEVAIDTNDFRFEVAADYDIFETGTFEAIETISTGLNNFGLDTPFGNIIVMIAGMLGVMWLTKSPLVALVAFLAIGATLILLGFSTNLTKIIFAGSAVMAVVIYFGSMNRREGVAG